MEAHKQWARENPKMQDFFEIFQSTQNLCIPCPKYQLSTRFSTCSRFFKFYCGHFVRLYADGSGSSEKEPDYAEILPTRRRTFQHSVQKL